MKSISFLIWNWEHYYFKRTHVLLSKLLSYTATYCEFIQGTASKIRVFRYFIFLAIQCHKMYNFSDWQTRSRISWVWTTRFSLRNQNLTKQVKFVQIGKKRDIIYREYLWKQKRANFDYIWKWHSSPEEENPAHSCSQCF